MNFDVLQNKLNDCCIVGDINPSSNERYEFIVYGKTDSCFTIKSTGSETSLGSLGRATIFASTSLLNSGAAEQAF